jgi:hypothetical protein
MFDWGIAQYMDEEEVNAVLENPQYCLFVDECGINMNQKDGGIAINDKSLGLPVATKLHQKNVPQVMFELQS